MSAKTALVTGAARGIGLAATRFVVEVTSTTMSRLDAWAAKVRSDAWTT